MCPLGIGVHKIIPFLSIIIPALNEEANLAATLASIPFIPDIEIILVDGGSRDQTIELARGLGVEVLQSLPGRARQMNAGARLASGEVLLFLHADTQLPDQFFSYVQGMMAKPGIAAGCFSLSILESGFALRVIACMANLRSRFLQMPYGDQAIFLRAKLFWKIGGFPELPVMEDVALVRRLRGLGRIETLPATVSTSSRRWQREGLLRTTLVHQIALIGYFLGVSPRRIARWRQSAI